MMMDKSLQTFNILVNISIATTKLEKLTVHEPHKIVELRPQTHLIIRGNIGSTKSTILSQISDEVKSPVYTSISTASLVGSIDKETKQVIPGACWEVKNNLLILDEQSFNLSKSTDTDLINALLQLTENQYYAKKIARYASDIKEKKKDLYFVVKSGTIKTKTRFAMLMATMHPLTKVHSDIMRALISRCIVYDFELTREQLRDIARGRTLYEHTEIEPPEKKAVIKLKDYEYIEEFVFNYNVGKSNYLRTIGELCRVFALFGKHNDKLYNLICALKSLYLKDYDTKEAKREGSGLDL
jgi:hypothetical protein